MSKLGYIFGNSFQRTSATLTKVRLENFSEYETGGRDREKYGKFLANVGMLRFEGRGRQRKNTIL